LKLELARVVASTLAGVDLVVEANLRVVLGTELDGTTELLRLASGLERPRSGTVRLDGLDPFRSPDTRGRVGVVLPIEDAWLGGTVADAIAIASTRREGARSADLLASLALEDWATRRWADLMPAERRTVAFACAVSLPAPAALVLFEPLELAGVTREAVLGALGRHLEDGSVVLAVTSSALDAARLSPEVVVLERGRLARGPTASLGLSLVQGLSPEFVVQTNAPRVLALALGSHAAVRSVSFDEEARPGELLARGPEPEAVARAVVHAAQATGSLLYAFGCRSPSSEVVRASTAGLVRAAYDGAYRSARSPRPAGGGQGVA
jgi:ABC-2 type transport system ATP-binding protein